jgi:hypothetical protein
LDTMDMLAFKPGVHALGIRSDGLLHLVGTSVV